MKRKTPISQADAGPGLPPLPDGARARLIKRMTRYITESFRARAEEVLEDPADLEPTMNGLRWHICGTFACDLELDYGDDIEEMIVAAYKQAGLPTSVVTPRRKPRTNTGTARSRRVES